MPVLLPAIAAATGVASAVLGYGLWKRKNAESSVTGLQDLLPESFTPTHQHTDKRGKTLLACDMKSATMFIATPGRKEAVLLPINHIDSVTIAESGELRVDELRLDIVFADDRNSFNQVHFINGPVVRDSKAYVQALAIAKKWVTRLNIGNADAASLREALSADTAPEEVVDSAPRWHMPLAAGLAGVSALSIAATMMVSDPVAPQADVRTAQVSQPILQAAKPSITSTAEEDSNSVSLASIIDPLQARIDDISEHSLTQANKMDTEKVFAALDEIDAIASELDRADAIATEKTDRRNLVELKAQLVSTQQDVLPRYRRLYSVVLQKDSDIALTALTSGYASRNIAVTHDSLAEPAAREILFSSLSEDLSRLRFARIDFRVSNDAIAVEDRELEVSSDAILGAAKPLINEDQ